MERMKVLFVCVHNSARSQMAEAFLNKLGGDRFQAESAGLEPGALNPLAVEVMREIGIDISQKKTQASSTCLSREGFSTTSLPSATKPAPKNAPSSPGPFNAITGVFAIPHD